MVAVRRDMGPVAGVHIDPTKTPARSKESLGNFSTSKAKD